MPGSYSDLSRIPEHIQLRSKTILSTILNLIPSVTPWGSITSIPSTPASFEALDSLLIAETLMNCSVSISPSHVPSPTGSPSLPSSPSWSYIGSKNDVRMYQSSSSNLHKFLGTTELDVTLDMVEEMMRDPANLKFIDPMCIELNIEAKLNGDHHILHAVFQMPPFIRNRDFVWIAVNRRLSNSLFVTAGRSIAVKEYGEKEGLIRGEIRASGFVVESIGDGSRVRMSYVAQVDPSGWVPTKLVNFVSREQAYKPGVIKEKLGEFKKQWNERHPDQKVA